MCQVRVLVCDPICTEAVHRMDAGGLHVDQRTGLSPEELEAVVGGYDAIVVRSATRLGARQIAAAHRLRLIVRGGVGTDNIDLDAAARQHIQVLNTPEASAVSVAELALGLLLALARRIPQADAALKAGRWPKKEFGNGVELAGKTLGLVGVGRVGGTLGRRALALDIAVIGTDTAREPSGYFEGMQLVSRSELFARADFVSVHIPHVGGSPAEIGEKEFALMKDGVLLINGSRGGVIDEMALLDALDRGRVRGAALDVFAEEPPHNRRLVNHPHIICTPHLGASTCEAQERVSMEVAKLLLERL